MVFLILLLHVNLPHLFFQWQCNILQRYFPPPSYHFISSSVLPGGTRWAWEQSRGFLTSVHSPWNGCVDLAKACMHFTFVFIKALFLNMYVIFMIEWKILCVYRVLCDFLVWSLNSTAKGFQGPSLCHTWSYVNTYLYFNYLCSARCLTQTWDCASISVIFLLTNS